MTREERNTKLKHFITCLKCEVSGKECDDNCPVQYEAGNMGEIIENLEAISKALEQESCEDWCDVPSNEMTLEQARQAVKDLRKKLAEYLEQQPCPDAISRSDMLDAIGHGTIYTSEELQKIIKGLPSVNPQPKMGWWIFDETLDKHYYCSECKSMGVDYWDFCPYCGAKMIEPQEREDKE